MLNKEDAPDLMETKLEDTERLLIETQKHACIDALETKDAKPGSSILDSEKIATNGDCLRLLV